MNIWSKIFEDMEQGSGADRRIWTADLTLTKGALYQLSHISKWGSDNDLLSHGETPHYHRRSCVSLLSSAWDQVVPQRYYYQKKSYIYSVINIKTPVIGLGFWIRRLAMTYFRMGRPHTIIGAAAFHFWVRHGIRWYHSAIVAKHKNVECLFIQRPWGD